MNDLKIKLVKEIYPRESEYIDKTTLYKLKDLNLVGSLSCLSFKESIPLSYFIKQYYGSIFNNSFQISKKDLYIENLYISKFKRRSGFGSLILEEMISEFNPDNIILLMSNEKGLLEFYEKSFIKFFYKLSLHDEKLLIFTKNN